MRLLFTLMIAAVATTVIAISCRSPIDNLSDVAAAQPTPKAEPRPKRQLALEDGEFDGRATKRSEAEWKKILTPDEFYILRQEGTEAPFTGELNDNKKTGTYHCAACGLALFSSQTKFDSGTGWPSFYEPLFKRNVVEKEDRSIGEVRTEVECARCGSHLGHVFDDGPRPTGLRYCMNSVSLRFKPEK